MKSSTAHTSDHEFFEPPEELRIVNWPLRDDGAAGWLFLSLAILVPLIIGVLTNNGTIILIGLPLVIVAMWRMWMPVTFQLGPRGVFESVWGRSRRIPWTAVKQWKVRRNGVLLLLSDHPAPVVRLWGVLVRYGNERETLIRLVRYFAGNPQSPEATNAARMFGESADTASITDSHIE